MNNSHKTAMARKKMSRPVRWLHSNGWLTKSSILDFGCGRGKDADELKALGYRVQKYDPHYAPRMPKATFRTVIMIYVLNVLGRERDCAVQQAWDRVRKGGRLIIVTRTDHDVAWCAKRYGWKKHGRGYITSTGTYEEGYSLTKLQSLTKGLSGVNGFATVGRTKAGGNTLFVFKK